ncbi:MAG: sigma-70 family RNA polymerase sigma factor [Cellulophaga sp.]|nr:sigma-70 family RNA polymerase sigma factor [Cellulophaga sp.]
MTKPKIHEDQKYIVGLLANSPLVIKSIYDRFVPKVVHYIKQNSGSEFDAKDVVQEVMVMIYNQAKFKNLELTCPFDAYFFLLCKRKWLNELKKSTKKEVTINEDLVSIDESASTHAFETQLEDEQQHLFDKMFEQLGNACKELLKMTFKIKSMEEVAENLGVSYAYARKKKSLCTGELTKMIQSSTEFKQLNQ